MQNERERLRKQRDGEQTGLRRRRATIDQQRQENDRRERQHARGAVGVAIVHRAHRRREEYNRTHPDRPLPITSSLSRILENDDEYVPYRTRSGEKRRAPATNPGIATIVSIAAALGTTVGDLLGERPYRVSTADRRKLRDFVRWLTVLFELDAPDLDDPPRARREK